MNKQAIDDLFFELLERWYGAELDLAQDWETGTENYVGLADQDYEEFKKRYKDIMNVEKDEERK